MSYLEQLKTDGEAPIWLDDIGFKTLSKGYLLKDETPKQAYIRITTASANSLGIPELQSRFFDIVWNNWLCPATPVFSNMGTNRGLPISCFSNNPGDSLHSIMDKASELAVLSKHGGGVGIYLGDLRARGTNIKGTGGQSDGVTAWAKIYDSIVQSVSQGGVRRGAAAVYLPVTHGDIEEFLSIRRPTGDINKRCLNLHHAVTIEDSFMESLKLGNSANRHTWETILTTRFETGEPYLFFSDNVERQKPESYRKHNLKISTSNICNEIYLHTDPDHTFVCCLSSLNLVRYDEWKNTDTVQLSVMFLDGVMQEFINKAKHIPGFESSVRFAEKSRALGLGVLGWHSLLQTKMLPFDSFDSMLLNAEIFKHIDTESLKASEYLANKLGEPEWCKGLGIRNTHRMAVAPTVSNSLISGNVSAGIEPLSANMYVQNSAKGTFIQKNNVLIDYLKSKNLDNNTTWNQINKDSGSVLNVKGLSKDEKEVFLTAREINQFALVRQAAQRQKYIDQGQSLNLFFGTNSDPKYIHQVHLEAWESGLKGLYYCRSESVLKPELASRQSDECKACES
jgi:ribonucleoside-diphosphate reductase alpha chain